MEADAVYQNYISKLHISLALYSPLLFPIPKQLRCGMCSGCNHAAEKSPGVFFLATARSTTLHSLTKDVSIAEKHFILGDLPHPV